MILLICNSNMFVPGVVTRVLKAPQEKFIIYTDMPGMEHFFQEMDFHNAVVIRYPNSYTLTSLFKVKRQMLSQLKPYHIERIEFYHAEEGQLANWLITKYSRKCEIYYCPPYVPLPYKKVRGLKRLKLKIIDRILYHYEADPLWEGGRVETSIAPSFFKENHVKQGVYETDHELNYTYLKSKYPQLQSEKKVILLTGSIIDTGAIPSEYDALVHHIIEVMGKDKMVTKCHPLFNDEYGEEKELAKLPSYIPFNMVLPMFDVVISFGSTALVEAAEAGKVAISTVFLVPFNNKDVNKAFYETLVSRNTGERKVRFPKTISELDDLLLENIR